MAEPHVVLKAGRDGPILGGHPWVYSGAVAVVGGKPQAGAIVRVVDADGRLLGRGTFSPHGAIAVRLFARDDAAIDVGFVHRRVRDAVALRRAVVPADTNAYRLVNGEGDGLPGVVADRYGDFVVVQFQTAGADAIATAVDDALEAECVPRGMYERSEGTVRREDGLRDRTGLRRGDAPPELLPVVECGARFFVDVRHGQKTGFFLDQRENRAMLRDVARGHRVLNAFAYTGGFAVAAGLGGASHVVSVETSAPALELAQRNWSENRLGAERGTFVRADVFQYFRDVRDAAGVVVLDPPAFAKRRRDVAAAIRGYREINRQAFLRLAPGGWLLTCSCSHHVVAETFRVAVMGAAAEARRAAHIVRHVGPGPDHPVALAHPEGDYLKGFLVRALD